MRIDASMEKNSGFRAGNHKSDCRYVRSDHLAFALECDAHDLQPCPICDPCYCKQYRLSFFFRWYDLWIGAYWDRKNRYLYICPLPMIGVRLSLPTWGRGMSPYLKQGESR